MTVGKKRQEMNIPFKKRVMSATEEERALATVAVGQPEGRAGEVAPYTTAEDLENANMARRSLATDTAKPRSAIDEERALQYAAAHYGEVTETLISPVTIVDAVVGVAELHLRNDVGGPSTIYMDSLGANLWAIGGGPAVMNFSSASVGMVLSLFPNGRPAIRSFPPASATAPGQAGEFTFDAGFFYVCTANNVWKRAALTTW